MIKRLSLLTTIICLTASLGYSTSKGTSGAQFLKIVSAPRPAAMAGTFTAFSGDLNSMVCNPAGLSLLEKKEVALNQNNWIQDISNQYVAVGMPVNNIGVFGLNVVMLSVKDVTRTDNTGNQNGTYGASDMAIGVAYAKKINDKMSLGTNIKMISSKIDDQTASGYGIDLGGLYKATEKVNLGLAVQNIGTGMKFINDSDPLPMTVKIGSGYKPMDKLTLGLDVNYPNDSNLYISVGGEYIVKNSDKLEFPVRLGYRTGMETGGMSGLAMGAGVLYNKTLGIDFAWTPVGDLGDSIKFGLSMKF